MYDFVDRPTGALTPGGRFLLWAMRGWVQAATAGRCPPGALAPFFARHGVLPALAPLHRVMARIDRDALGKVAFAPPGCCRIGEDEAVLLQIFRDAAEAPERAEETLALLLEEEAVGPAFTDLLGAILRLRDGGLERVALTLARKG